MSKKPQLSKNRYEVDNIYSLLGHSLKEKYDDFQLEDGKHILIIGKTGDGKSNIIPAILKQSATKSNQQCGYDKVLLFSGSDPDEPVYHYCRDNLVGKEHWESYKGFSQLDSVIEEIREDGIEGGPLAKDTFFGIFDDALGVSKKLQDKFDSLVTWFRKLTNTRCNTMCFLTQSYFDTPKIIRKNIKYILIMGGFDKRQLRGICSQFSSNNVSLDKIYDMYLRATQSEETNKTGKRDITKFFLIDQNTAHDNLKFRNGFDDPFIINPNAKKDFK